MSVSYNRIAGQSVERLAALSDGIFAVAMTLMVLDLRLPAAAAIHSEHDLWRALVALLPRLLTYFMSFLTLGIFWVGQQTQLNHLARSDRHLSWIHLGFLFAVTLGPVFNHAAGGVHGLSRGAAGLLGQHSAVGSDFVRQLGIRPAGRVGER